MYYEDCGSKRIVVVVAIVVVVVIAIVIVHTRTKKLRQYPARNPSTGAPISYTKPWSQPFPE